MNDDALMQLAQEIHDGELTIAMLRNQKDGMRRGEARYQHLTHEIRLLEPAVSLLKRTFQAAISRRLGEIAGVDGGTPPYEQAVTKPVADRIRYIAQINAINLEDVYSNEPSGAADD